MSDILECISETKKKFVTAVGKEPNVIYINMADYRELSESVPSHADKNGLDEILGMKIIKRAGAMECVFDEKILLDDFNENILKPELETIGLTLADDGIIQQTENSITIKHTMTFDEAEKYCQDLKERIRDNYKKANEIQKSFFGARESRELQFVEGKQWADNPREKTVVEKADEAHLDLLANSAYKKIVEEANASALAADASPICEHGIIKSDCAKCSAAMLMMILEWALEVVERFIDGELPQDGYVSPEIKKEYERAKAFFDSAKLTYLVNQESR